MMSKYNQQSGSTISASEFRLISKPTSPCKDCVDVHPFRFRLTSKALCVCEQLCSYRASSGTRNNSVRVESLTIVPLADQFSLLLVQARIRILAVMPSVVERILDTSLLTVLWVYNKHVAVCCL